MEKLSFSEMEEVQGGNAIFGSPYFMCGIATAIIMKGQSTVDIALFDKGAQLYDQIGCKNYGF